jgi:hypothetical protein
MVGEGVAVGDHSGVGEMGLDREMDELDTWKHDD